MGFEFIIVGLTGPVGSGCSTLAKAIEMVKPSEYIEGGGLIQQVSEDIGQVYARVRAGDADKLARLKSLLVERECLDVIARSRDSRFVRISMSAVILKKAIESMNCDEYRAWAEKNSRISEQLEQLKDRWTEVIKVFDDAETRHFEGLSENAISQIDEMWSAFEKARNKIVAIEFEQLAGELDALHLQHFGDNLRKTGNAFAEQAHVETTQEHLQVIAREVNKVVKYHRNRSDGKEADCFVVDAFRNPLEVDFFRQRYEQFFLVSIYASESVRRVRVQKSHVKKLAPDVFDRLFEKINKKDWGDESGETKIYEQNVSSCFYLADIAINNDKDRRNPNTDLFREFSRYYALMLSPGCVQPRREETYMDLAYSLSLRSSCISRKVGAVITDNEGYVLGLGWNEAAHGQIGCGYRHIGDYDTEDPILGTELLKGILDPDDFQGLAHHAFCFKDILSRRKIREKIKDAKLSEADKAEVLRVLTLKRLEYCRSLHAEENALLQVAARGGMGVRGGDIYTTTFPCELCAKKIYQAGIRRIFFTEPYPNSISESVFLKDGTRLVELIPFEGVKSPSYHRLFRPRLDRKEAQKLEQAQAKK